MALSSAIQDGGATGKWPRATVHIPGYELGALIGVGGMATVHLATQLNLRRQVALKIIAPNFAADGAFRARFIAEGQLTARLLHRHILTVFDIGEADGSLYLATEYLSGGTLLDRMAESLPLAERLRIVREVCEGLVYAHEAKVVHRDIKPGNVLFRSDGSAVLADFGIAKALDITRSPTMQGAMIGTPSYMSPEQAQGENIDPRSDLYSVGVMLYELIVGRLPFSADDPISMALAHVVRDPPPLPPEHAALQPLVTSLLRKKPAERLGSARELVDRLRELESELVATPGAERLPPRTRPVRPPTPHGSRWRIVAAAGVLLSGGIAVATWLMRGDLPWTASSGKAPSIYETDPWQALGAEVRQRVEGKDYFSPRGGSAHDALALMLAEKPSDPLALTLLTELCDAVARDIGILIDSGARSRAAQLLDEALSRFPNHAEFVALRARLAPEPETPITVVRSETMPVRDLAALRMEAAELPDGGHGEDAIALYREILVLAPGDATALSNLKRIAGEYAAVARNWMSRARPDQAFVIAERGLIADPGNAELLQLRSEARAQVDGTD
jgi:serine/threonine protein kinase